MVKRIFNLKGLRVICTCLLAVALLALIVNVTLYSITNNRYYKDRNAKRNAFEIMVESFEFNGLDDTSKEKALELAALYGDYSNIIVTGNTGNVVYNLNEGYMPDKNVFNVIVDTSSNLSHYSYGFIIDKDNAIKYQMRFDRVYNSLKLYEFSKNISLINFEFMDDKEKRLLDIYQSSSSGKYMNYAYIGSKGWNVYTIFNNMRYDTFKYDNKWFDALEGIGIAAFVFFWLLLPIWVFMDARKLDFKPALWGFLVIFTNIIGFIVYLVVKPEPILCKKCSHVLDNRFVTCPYCGTQNRALCKQCKGILEDTWSICPYCGTEIENIKTGPAIEQLSE